MHSTLLDHFQNPRNVGELEPPALVVEVSNPICGDRLKLSARLDGDTLREVRFKTRGCTASIAASSALTEMLTGRTLADVQRLSAQDVDSAVGGLPNESKHAAALCVDAVRALVSRARSLK